MSQLVDPIWKFFSIFENFLSFDKNLLRWFLCFRIKWIQSFISSLCGAAIIILRSLSLSWIELARLLEASVALKLPKITISKIDSDFALGSAENFNDPFFRQAQTSCQFVDSSCHKCTNPSCIISLKTGIELKRKYNLNSKIVALIDYMKNV